MDLIEFEPMLNDPNAENIFLIPIKYAENKLYIMPHNDKITLAKYIYQYNNWPNFTWDEQKIQVILGKVRHIRGKILRQMSALGFSIKEEAMLSTLTLEVLKSSEIEGENLNYDQVRSSIAIRLGIEFAGMVNSDRDVEHTA